MSKNISGVYATDSMSNCKLTVLDHVGGRQKATIDKVLKESRQTVYMTLTNAKDRDYILKNYETYFCETVPVGYGNTPKANEVYHILIKNHLTCYNKEYLRPKIEKEDSKLNIKEIKVKFTEIFKAKRRKTDLVNDLLKAIKQ